MKSLKIKIEPVKVKSFVTNTKQVKGKRGRNDGGYTWVG